MDAGTKADEIALALEAPLVGAGVRTCGLGPRVRLRRGPGAVGLVSSAGP